MGNQREKVKKGKKKREKDNSREKESLKKKGRWEERKKTYEQYTVRYKRCVTE